MTTKIGRPSDYNIWKYFDPYSIVYVFHEIFD